MFSHASLRRWVPALLCALLVGCGASTATTPTAAPTTSAPTSVPPTTVPPTAVPPTDAPAEPTAAPEPTAEPTEAAVEPTAEPAGEVTTGPVDEPLTSGMLPAPLYFIDAEGQISRIEIDGTTITQITSEADKVFEFVASPADGSLAYITIAGDGFTTTLIHADAMGQGRTELQTGILRGVTIGYAGDTIEVGVLDPPAGMEMTPQVLTPGTWSFPIAGGEPAQIQAATPPTQGADGNPVPGDHYMPIAWSPDGQKLLLRTSINFGPDQPGGDVGTTGLALFEKGTGEVRQLLPTSSEPLCIGTAWDTQSTAVYCSTAYSLGDNTPALWRLNVVTGEQQPLIPIQDGDKTNSVFSVREMDDGLYSLVGASDSSSPETLSYTAQRTGLDAVSNAEQLIADPLPLGYGWVLWGDDASSMVVPIAKGDGEVDLTWYPFLGGKPFVLVSGQLGATLAWGK